MSTWNKLLDPVIWWPILTVIGVVLVDTILGVIISIKDKNFDWNKLGDWLGKIGIQVSGLVVLGIICIFQKAVWIAFAPALATYTAVLVASIISKIKSFIPA
jgi:CHASE2 domain-containing sensor protein